MGMFLTDAELEEMTGLKRGADQARWYEKRGYYVECNARGKPRITHVQVNQKRQINSVNQADNPAAFKEPNILAFKAKLHNAQR
jgi:hypothetical protein